MLIIKHGVFLVLFFGLVNRTHTIYELCLSFNIHCGFKLHTDNRRANIAAVSLLVSESLYGMVYTY